MTQQDNLVRAFSQPSLPHLHAATHLVRADLLLVFGNCIIPDELADTALHLWHGGFADHIAVAGGAQPEFDHFQEAIYIRHCLMKGGVPADAITIEDQSTNTLENARFTRKVLEANGRFDQIGSVIGVGHAVAGTRFAMTLAANWDKPDLLLMHVPVMPKGLELAQILDYPAFHERALAEAAKIPTYTARGHIAPIDVEATNIRVAERIAANLAHVQACESAGKPLTPQQRQHLTTYRYLHDQPAPKHRTCHRTIGQP